MAPAKSLDAKDLLLGGGLQCAEAATFGMPFEVWKTHMGMNRHLGPLASFREIYRTTGVSAFWKGWQPKMVESFLKGGILLFAKEGTIRSCKKFFGSSDVFAGFVGGFVGGVAQVSVISPCTYLITAAVAAEGGQIAKMSYMERISVTFKQYGIAGFYRGSFPLMFRQGSNWASRQGLTDVSRALIKRIKGNDNQLSTAEEIMSGTIGGGLSVWNQPFEVARIRAQRAAAGGDSSKGMVTWLTLIHSEGGGGFKGYRALFQGWQPRAGLCVVQTIFMVAIPTIFKNLGWISK